MGGGRSQGKTLRVIFNLSLNDGKQPAFQRLRKECSSQKGLLVQRASITNGLGILKGQKACMAGAEGTDRRMVRR